jgi:hypothetical protein
MKAAATTVMAKAKRIGREDVLLGCAWRGKKENALSAYCSL